MVAYNMSNVHVSPHVLATLLLLQQGKLYKLQQKIMREIPRGSRPEVIVKKAGLKTTQNLSLFLIKLQNFRSATLLKRDSNTDVFL